jgi:hypothetical protein
MPVRYAGMPIGNSGVENATTMLTAAAKEFWEDEGAFAWLRCMTYWTRTTAR